MSSAAQPASAALPTVGRWEWRTFEIDPGAARRLAARSTVRVQESDELYVLSPRDDAAVKVRAGLLDVKALQHVRADGLEQWLPVLKAPLPLTPDDARRVLAALGVAGPPVATAEALASLPDVRAVQVHKRRRHYRVDGCMVELTDLRVGRQTARTLAVEAEDPDRVSRTVRTLGLAGRDNVSVVRGLKRLTARRAAVIDVGTNSVKFLLAERGGGAWRPLADRAELTRLGAAVERTGRLEPEAIERTVAAIADMVAEATRAGADGIAAVGTAGLRQAANASDFLSAVRARCGIEVAVIGGEDEARLAYLATTSTLTTPASDLVVFDSGGGSSQFTFGSPDHVTERFSVDVGAVRIAERFGLDAAVGEKAVAAALAAIARDLARLDGRRRPRMVIGMGGTVTNLAAVRHRLATYDPDAIHGTVLERAEVDRQIALYRSRGAAERRSLAGLQPERADIILAGACIVRCVLTLLEADALTVSDRGLRHGVLAERFGPRGAP